MTNFVKRTLTGTLFVILTVASLIISQWTFLFVFSIIIIMLLFEFYRLATLERTSPQMLPGILSGLAVFWISWFVATGLVESKCYILLIPFIIVIFLSELFRNLQKPFANIAYTLTGIIYIAVPVSLFQTFVLIDNQYNPFILLGIFVMIWVFDTCAYLVGVSFGKNRLFERISPKKSWEGFWGGLILTLGAAYLYADFSGILTHLNWMIIAAIIAVFGTLGDLVESLFKRSLGTKDSGHILPGHGGFLDRFDSIIFATPMIFLYLQFIN